MKPTPNNNSPVQPEHNEDHTDGSFSGYPPYPVSEDIYNQLTEEQELDPDDVNNVKGTRLFGG